MEAHKVASGSSGICLGKGAGISSVVRVVSNTASGGVVVSCSAVEEARAPVGALFFCSIVLVILLFGCASLGNIGLRWARAANFLLYILLGLKQRLVDNNVLLASWGGWRRVDLFPPWCGCE